MKSADVVLVSMPWSVVRSPSIQLGTLHALLARRGIGVASCSLYLDFFKQLLEDSSISMSVSEYQTAAEQFWLSGLLEWVFCVPPYLREDPRRDREYQSFLLTSGTDPAVIEKFMAIRGRVVPGFLEIALQEILAMSPRIVGFTTTFAQNVPSLVLARMIKNARPGITIVFGGGNVSGVMGKRMHRAFPWLDIVVRVEAEAVFPPLVEELLEGREPELYPGLVLRRSGDTVANDAPYLKPDVAALPIPDYDEFFGRLERLGLESNRIGSIRLPIETARGCWWGEKHHCTFCGLNGQTMAFRAKSPDRAKQEIEALSSRYRSVEFDVVDNIIDMRYFTTLLPLLAGAEMDLDLFYETKANLSREQIRLMRAAGIRHFQPGLESLDTSTLKLMDKGTTALQNIRLLKWCAEYGVGVGWNILFGFAGEDPAAYERMARLAPALVHLNPPNLCAVLVNRFSPMHTRPAELGIELTGALPFYRYIYPELASDELDEIAYFFGHKYPDGQKPASYVQDLRRALDLWKANHLRSWGRLTYVRGKDFLRIIDARSDPPGGQGEYVLDEMESMIYQFCDQGKKADVIYEKLESMFPGRLTRSAVVEFLDSLVENRLACQVDGRYLSLAIPQASGWRAPLEAGQAPPPPAAVT